MVVAGEGSEGSAGRASRGVLPVAILASFVVFLDGTVVSVALPAIGREFGGGLALQQWTVDAYLVTLGSLLLLAGSLSDRLGRRRAMTIGLIGFGITSVLAALAPSGEILILARALQGAAGALLVPSSLALIIHSTTGRAQAAMIGAWTAWTGTATLIGPVVGGVLVDLGSWRLVFWLIVPPIAATLVLLRGIEKDGPSIAGRIDLVGGVLGIVGLGGPVLALIEQARLGWGHPLVVGGLVIGGAAFVAFLLWERRAADPMLPLTLFSVRNFAVGNASTALVYGAISLGFLVVGLYLQEVGGYSATLAGVATLPPTIVMLLLSQRFGSLSGRFGARLFMGFGPVVAAGGFLLLLRADERPDLVTQVVPAMIVVGLGLALTVAPLTAAILGSVPPERSGIGSAVNNAVSRVAGLVTIALLSVVAGGALDQGGFRRVVITAAALLALGGIVSLIGIVDRRGNND